MTFVLLQIGADVKRDIFLLFLLTSFICSAILTTRLPSFMIILLFRSMTINKDPELSCSNLVLGERL